MSYTYICVAPAFCVFLTPHDWQYRNWGFVPHAPGTKESKIRFLTNGSLDPHNAAFRSSPRSLSVQSYLQTMATSSSTRALQINAESQRLTLKASVNFIFLFSWIHDMSWASTVKCLNPQTWYLSIFLHKHIFQILEIYPQKARKSRHFKPKI